jgi:hypothetical protein
MGFGCLDVIKSCWYSGVGEGGLGVPLNNGY